MAKTVKMVWCSRLQYKCRKCGDLFTGSTPYKEWDSIWSQFHRLEYTDEQEDLLDKMVGDPVEKSNPFRHSRSYRTHTHKCSDSGVGLGDLVGAESPISLPIKRGTVVQPTSDEKGTDGETKGE